MRKKAIHDKSVGQTIRCKNKGMSKRYAFADYSDDIQIGGKVKQVYTHKFYDDMNSKTKGFDKLQELAKSMRKVQLVKTHGDKGRIRCNMTHIWNGKRWAVINQIMTISQVKREYPNVLELMYSKNDDVYGDVYKAAENVN